MQPLPLSLMKNWHEISGAYAAVRFGCRLCPEINGSSFPATQISMTSALPHREYFNNISATGGPFISVPAIYGSGQAYVYSDAVPFCGSVCHSMAPEYTASLDEPTRPRLVGELNGYLNNPKCIYTQFRYAFVTDDDGLKVLDISNPTHPRPIRERTPAPPQPQLVPAATHKAICGGFAKVALASIRQPPAQRD